MSVFVSSKTYTPISGSLSALKFARNETSSSQGARKASISAAVGVLKCRLRLSRSTKRSPERLRTQAADEQLKTG